MEAIERFLDEEGRLTVWPGKQKNKLMALTYLAGKFEPDRRYTEHEVNAILGSWHTFSDPFILRRSLIEAGRAREAEFTLDDLAGGFLLGNALRGLMKAELML